MIDHEGKETQLDLFTENSKTFDQGISVLDLSLWFIGIVGLSMGILLSGCSGTGKGTISYDIDNAIQKSPPVDQP